jgi:hypothetical protein
MKKWIGDEICSSSAIGRGKRNGPSPQSYLPPILHEQLLSPPKPKTRMGIYSKLYQSMSSLKRSVFTPDNNKSDNRGTQNKGGNIKSSGSKNKKKSNKRIFHKFAPPMEENNSPQENLGSY